MLSVELLGVGAHRVLDHSTGGTVVLGELLDQIGDVLGHPHPELDRGFPARPTPAPLRCGRHGLCRRGVCIGGDDTTGVMGWGMAAREGV